jgi:hypothetical protein
MLKVDSQANFACKACKACRRCHVRIHQHPGWYALTCPVVSCRRVDASASLDVTSSCAEDSSGDTRERGLGWGPRQDCTEAGSCRNGDLRHEQVYVAALMMHSVSANCCCSAGMVQHTTLAQHSRHTMPRDVDHTAPHSHAI